MRKWISVLAVVVALALAGTAFAGNDQPQATEKPACGCCLPPGLDLFVGLQNLLGCGACAPVACDKPACQPVVCPAPEPAVCAAPMFPCLRAQVQAAGQQLRSALCCPKPACGAVVQAEPKPEACAAACPPAVRPTLLDVLRARMQCVAPQCGRPSCCPGVGLLQAVMGLLGGGCSPCCQAVEHEAAQPTPAASPTEAPADQIKPLPPAPPKPDPAA
jgi:hypothetical protein